MVEGYYCSYLEHGTVNASLNEPRWRTLVNHRYVHRTVAVFSVFEFFQNEEIYVTLDELDELDRIAHA